MRWISKECNEGNIFFDCGQCFSVLDKATWEEIKELGKFKNVEIDKDWMVKSIATLMEFCEENEDFVCTLTRFQIGKMKGICVPILFYLLNGQKVRVGLENAKCSMCGWEGIIANPTVPYLYENVEKRFELLRQVAKLPVKNCPNCSRKLERNAIWIGGKLA